ncbi:MAG TPA: hypothetical protein VGF81_11095 [Solirubrobacteraceae bacterium]
MRRTLGVMVLGCLLAAGCGDSRAPVPSLTRPAPAHGYRTVHFTDAGVSIASPAGWSPIAERPPLSTAVTSGDAVIALWRYPRRQPPPASPAALGEARASLVAAVRARERSVRVISARTARIDGSPAIELSALETIGGHPRQVLSTHLFTDRGEVVLEEYAPPAIFRAIGGSLFARVRRSLTVTGGNG